MCKMDGRKRERGEDGDERKREECRRRGWMDKQKGKAHHLMTRTQSQQPEILQRAEGNKKVQQSRPQISLHKLN